MADGKVHVYVKPKGGEHKTLGGVIHTSAKGEIIEPKKKREEKEYAADELKELVSKVVKEEHKEQVAEEKTEIAEEADAPVLKTEINEEILVQGEQQSLVGASMSLGEHVHTLHQLQSDFGVVLSGFETNVKLEAPKIEKKEVNMQIQLDPYIRQNEPVLVLEAALFMAGQGLDNTSLGKVVGIASVSQVQKMMSELSEKYKVAGSAIEIMQDADKKWNMRVKSNYAPAVKQFAGEAEISKRALRTLAYVSKNNGVTKRNLFKRLGGSIYEDVAELTEKGFVATTPFGRTKKVHITDKFKQYFEM